MSPELYEELSNVIDIIKKVRHKALDSRIFEALCEEIGSKYTHLLRHAEMRWLSRNKILTRIFALREKAFSSVAAERYRSQLEINAVLHLAVTTLDPNIHSLVPSKQQYPSH
ncbi:uncharacterized protein TNCV_2668771 [Trichonephila clavipes]|nr:uncharacterized protein TNCV_2668771 [Trichonephila clavipes]